MDPSHGPYVHSAWWWRSKHSIHEKAKGFAPVDPWGFKMMRHPPSSNSKAYRLLGKGITTEIIFQLPGVRIEHILAEKQVINALTTVTPINENKTEIHQFFYWNSTWLNLLKPLLRTFAVKFLEQDYRVVMRQQEGLKENPSLIFLNDADTQAKWYYQLKKEYLNAQQENRDFINPINETILKWRS